MVSTSMVMENLYSHLGYRPVGFANFSILNANDSARLARAAILIFPLPVEAPRHFGSYREPPHMYPHGSTPECQYNRGGGGGIHSVEPMGQVVFVTVVAGGTEVVVVAFHTRVSAPWKTCKVRQSENNIQ